MADGVSIVFGLFVAGILGFFLMGVVLVTRVMGFVFRALTGVGRRPKVRPIRPEVAQGANRICSGPGCGNINHRGARFCARCGRPLTPRDDFDAYG